MTILMLPDGVGVRGDGEGRVLLEFDVQDEDLGVDQLVGGGKGRGNLWRA